VDEVILYGFNYFRIKRNVSPMLTTSPVHVHKYDGIVNFCNNPNSPIAINNVSSTNGLCKMMDQSMLSPQAVEMEDYVSGDCEVGNVRNQAHFFFFSSFC
jgi:hypothetical protein